MATRKVEARKGEGGVWRVFAGKHYLASVPPQPHEDDDRRIAEGIAAALNDILPSADLGALLWVWLRQREMEIAD